MRFNFAGSVLIPLSLRMLPRNVTERCPNEHFDGFNFKFAFLRRFSANSRRSRCSLNVRPNMIMLSKYARQVLEHFAEDDCHQAHEGSGCRRESKRHNCVLK